MSEADVQRWAHEMANRVMTAQGGRRKVVRGQVAYAFIIALLRHPSMHLLDIAREIGVAPGAGTLRNARDDLKELEIVRGGDHRFDHYYLAKRPPEAVLADVTPIRPGPPDSGVSSPECSCDRPIIGEEGCLKCGQRVRTAA